MSAEEMEKVRQNNINVSKRLILEGALSEKQKKVREKKEDNPNRKKKIKIIYIKRGMKLVTDVGQFCAIDAVKKYNASMVPDNI